MSNCSATYNVRTYYDLPFDDRSEVKNYEHHTPSVSQLQHCQLPERLDNSECLKVFGPNHVTNYRGILLVSNITNATNSVLRFLGANESYAYNGYKICTRAQQSFLAKREMKPGFTTLQVLILLPKVGKYLILTTSQAI